MYIQAFTCKWQACIPAPWAWGGLADCWSWKLWLQGLPAIVSEWTGAAEVVEQVWPEGVVPLSAEKATEAVVRYFSLTETEKRLLSEKSATLIREKYRLSQAIAIFQSAFAEALKVVGLL
jgi:hypothetical protein